MRLHTEAQLAEARVIGQRLRWAREALDMSCVQLAAHAGVDASLIYAMEKGARVPSIFLAMSLIHILGISPQYLLWGVLQGCEIEVQTKLALTHHDQLMLPDKIVRAETPNPGKTRKTIRKGGRGEIVARR